ncbi:uncharacterized protein [Neodiprion pinetum]|uniref:uncharacterized protein n=1 Tax=Neodiprion pinetum TaxID=441929 RepID=UPI001EDE4E33|nr:uncharacterized protein LOC124217525 [Neodiprion pinetum]
MWNLSCEIFASMCIVAVILSQFVTEAKKTCLIVSLLPADGCTKNETCKQTNNQTGECECLPNYQRLNDKCVSIPTTTESLIDPNTMKQDTGESSGGGVTAGLLVPLFLILLTALVFLSARRYKWVQRLRQYRQNRYGNVLVTRDEDDDDPPIV